MKKCSKIWKKLDDWLYKLDHAPLWLLVFPLLLLYFWYYLLLGENGFFEIHDQLDERVVNNVFHARHLFERMAFFPEMYEGGVPKSGMTVSAITFIFYRWFSPYVAFMLEYLVAEICAYLGTYFSIRKFAKSSILAVLGGMAMMWLNFRSSYGLCIVGFPILFYAFSDLFEKAYDGRERKEERKWKAGLIRDMLLIVFYGCMTHLAWIGYAVVMILFVMDMVLFVISCVRKRWLQFFWFYAGSALLVLTDIVMYRDLFLQFFLGTSYVSHRNDWGVSGYPFRQAWNIFWHGDGAYIYSVQSFLILPMLVLLIVYGIRFRKLERAEKVTWILAGALFLANVLFALIYGFYGSDFYVNVRKSSNGILRSFQFNRFFWLYPGTWYIGAGLLFSLPVRYHGPRGEEAESYRLTKRWPLPVLWLLILLVIFPAAWETRQKSKWLLNKSQYKNHMSVGLISWKDFFAEDLMQEIDRYIGKEKSSYRIACLGLYPCVPQVAGFYTIDGYSDNYPLEYKRRFRKIIEKELEKNPSNAGYYDTWGSRVYLFTAESPERYGAKSENFVYENLEIDTSLMRDMGCQYIFSAGEILDCEKLNLELEKIFEREDSFYRIYLYRIKQDT